MTVAVKICGLSTSTGLGAAIAGGARFVGFVFYPPSPRSVTPEEAKPLASSVAPGITRVGVFVDPDDAMLAAVLAKVPLDMLQFHGSETPERLVAIKERFRLKIMKAIKVAGEIDLQAARDYFAIADWLMFDAKPPKGHHGALPGGNAVAFDWKLLRQRNWPLPWMLSGGLTVDNLSDAASISRAEIVDVSSGVERRPGEKDPDKIRAFLARAQAL
jgi:phosphoribosylanthranilate isomerase